MGTKIQREMNLGWPRISVHIDKEESCLAWIFGAHINKEEDIRIPTMTPKKAVKFWSLLIFGTQDIIPILVPFDIWYTGHIYFFRWGWLERDA